MRNGFDAIIIGSGFGGAVTTYRLAEAGARVLVLERGRRWTPEQYPRQPQMPGSTTILCQKSSMAGSTCASFTV